VIFGNKDHKFKASNDLYMRFCVAAVVLWTDGLSQDMNAEFSTVDDFTPAATSLDPV
jgi:hypothetical protein